MKLLIADDHILLSQVLATSLEGQGISCRMVSDLPQVLAAFKKESFDIVLLDVNMPGMNGAHSVEVVSKADKNAKVLLFSGQLSGEFVNAAMNVGAYGYVQKSTKFQSLVGILSLVQSGQKYLPSELFGQKPKGEDTFSERDVGIIRAISDGATNKEIALCYACSEANIKSYIRSLCARLEAKNRAHLVTKAKEATLI